MTNRPEVCGIQRVIINCLKMDRRLQYTMTLLFLLIHFTAASDENMVTVLKKLPPECSYKLSASGELVAFNVSLLPAEIHVGNYESIIVSSPGDVITRDVIIYWENYLKCNGVAQFHYKAFYLTKTYGGKFVKVYTDLIYTNHAIFTGLRYDVAYNFEVVSIDKHGASDVSIIYVPSDTDKTKPRKPLWLEKKWISRGVFMLLWDNPLSQQLSGFNQSIQFTLHWCENEPNSLTQCNGKMYRILVPITESRQEVKVENPKKHYQFAISTEITKGDVIYSTVSSGLQWEKCSLPLNIRPEVIIIRKIWTTVVSSTFIGLRWKIDCSSMSDIFTSYQIYYCPVMSNKNHKCQEKVMHKFIGKYPKNNTLPLAMIQNLKPATLYMFTVDSLTQVNNNIGKIFRTVSKLQSTSPE